MSLAIVILAAGHGKRMRSSLPKVLHTLAGKPILERITDTACKLEPQAIYIVYGHGGTQIREKLTHLSVFWIEQAQQLGTGHALAQAMPHISDNTRVLVLVGDIPLVTVASLQKLLTATPIDHVGILTARVPDATGLGRVLRNEHHHVIRVIEHKDATAEQRAIAEINSAILVAPAPALKRWLPQLKNNNAQSEYYLPDIIPLALAEKIPVHGVLVEQYEEVLGINDRAQLAQLERYYQMQQARELMLKGVTLLDPQRFDLRGELHSAQDVTIDVNVVIEGQVTIDENTYIGPNTLLRDSKIGKNVLIKSHCVIEGAIVADNCIIGPFARLRPDTQLASHVHIGNFVEIKKSILGTGTKANHLSYVGDANVGSAVNIGAGVITCNYDGVNKNVTTIEDGAFIGSNAQLVAPVTIGKNATIGAGSTITRDAPAEALTLTRAEQRNIANWKPRKKNKPDEKK